MTIITVIDVVVIIIDCSSIGNDTKSVTTSYNNPIYNNNNKGKMSSPLTPNLFTSLKGFWCANSSY